MYRRALARHRTGAALLLGLSLRAPSASAEPPPPIVFLDRVRVPSLYQVGFGPSVIEANLRLFDVGGLIENPFARGRGNLLPALLSLFSPEVKLDYRDYQTRATYEPSARDRFSVLGFGSPLGEKRNGILERLGDACRPRITFIW